MKVGILYFIPIIIFAHPTLSMVKVEAFYLDHFYTIMDHSSSYFDLMV